MTRSRRTEKTPGAARREWSSESTPSDRDRHPLAELHGTAGNRAVSDVLDSVQCKLRVGHSKDPAELEAEDMSARVVAQIGVGHDGERCAAGCSHSGDSIARMPIGASGGALEAEQERTIKEAAGSGGSSLPEQTRDEMEGAFGVGFGAVRVHSDATAAMLTRSMSARAFTLGSHIFLGDGEKVTDRSLMAHELTHTVQQQAHE